MFTQEFITLGTQTQTQTHSQPQSSNTNNTNNTNDIPISLSLPLPLPGFNRELVTHEDYYNTTNSITHTNTNIQTKHTKYTNQDININRHILDDTLYKFKIGIENKLNRLHYLLQK